MSYYFRLIKEDLFKKEGKIDFHETKKIYESREYVLRCLYALLKIYESLDVSYEDFKRSLKEKPTYEIREVLSKKIANYRKSKDLDTWKEEIVLIMYGRDIKNKKRGIESPMVFGKEIRSILDLLFYISSRHEDIETEINVF